MKTLLAILLAWGAPSALAAPACHYMLVKDSGTVGWTAFKTMQKAAVNGSFKAIEVSGSRHSNSLSKLLEGLTVTMKAESSDSGNPARDKTLQDMFFGKLADMKISGKLRRVSENEKTAELELTFNGQTHAVPMKFTYENDEISALGTFDLLQFGAGAAHEALHKACEKLHMGSDGVSKTWTEVNVNLKGKITKLCR